MTDVRFSSVGLATGPRIHYAEQGDASGRAHGGRRPHLPLTIGAVAVLAVLGTLLWLLLLPPEPPIVKPLPEPPPAPPSQIASPPPVIAPRPASSRSRWAH